MWLPSLLRVTILASTLHIVSATSHAKDYAAGPIHQLIARQSNSTFDPSQTIPGFPNECLATCNPYFDALLAKCVGPTATPNCGCTVDIEKEYVTCLNCVVGIKKDSVSQMQFFLTSFIKNCDKYGTPLPATTINGGVFDSTSTAPAAQGSQATAPIATVSSSGAAVNTRSTTVASAAASNGAPQPSNSPASAGNGGDGPPSAMMWTWATAIAVAGVVFGAIF